MPPRPRQWQSQLIQLLRRRLERQEPGGQDVLIHAGPGAGKTLGALLGYQALAADGRIARFVVFTHRSSIASQWRQAACRLGLELRDWDPASPWPLPSGDTVAGPRDALRDGPGNSLSLRNGPRNGPREAPREAPRDGPAASQGLLLTYQAASRNLAVLQEHLASAELGAWMAIADEVHHLGLDPEEPEASAWGQTFSSLTAGASLRLGLTGTPFRADKLGFCSARRIQVEEAGERVELIAPDLSVEPRQLIAAGDVRPLEFRFQDGWIDHGRQEGTNPELERSPLSAEGRESWRARNLRRAIRLGDASSIALRVLLNARKRLELVRRHHPEAGGIVIARDIAHARRLGLLLVEQGDQVLLVHSQDPEAASRLADFQNGRADWLVSIDMASEGFDAPRLRVVAYLTTVVTRSRFVQAITRAVRIDGERSQLESVPRHPSYVFAPADPLLIQYARNWSISEPYLLRSRPGPAEAVAAQGWGRAPGLPLEAMAEGAGELIRLRGPQLPSFLLQP